VQTITFTRKKSFRGCHSLKNLNNFFDFNFYKTFRLKQFYFQDHEDLNSKKLIVVDPNHLLGSQAGFVIMPIDHLRPVFPAPSVPRYDSYQSNHASNTNLYPKVE
jgi:hypothetical protein